ncbi:MAG: PaaI family thioesterase [Giesbergeria sp.]|uniref:PaaI family thioesterase n=1 Tax=Candidatus Skiveiella danica TaxID=3386177 RepID=UPI001B7BB9AC|nr:PaaI family thioesterase [Betaproteobacteria bacterium]MBP6307968.1 PaaI family thioesterase [Burkholderiaceae bacterium]MBP9784341.1 PaaI family thioesterase [Giesbergeria sp.]
MSLPPPGDGAWTREGLQGYGLHVGPIWCDANGPLALRIEERHTNITGRVHGGMAMGLASMGLARAAQGAARAARPGSRATLLNLNVELIDSAQVGDWLFTEAIVQRTTRTMVFVAGGLRSGERTVLTASAVYQIEAEASPSRLRASETMALHPDHSVREPVDAFSAHVGTFHVRADAQGEPIGGLQVLPDCLDARGGDEIDAGMVLMMADLFLGRRARTLSGSVCVTVGMGISRLAPVRLGDALEVESHTEGQHGETLVVSGRFRVNSLPVFSATSLWKMVEKK